MSWALLDDDFPNHPKTIAAGRDAAYLFVCGLCYCRKFHTGGFLSRQAVKRLGVDTGLQRMVDKLVTAVLWEVADGGYRVHDYTQMYDDVDGKAALDEKRERRREAGRKGGLAKASNARELLAQNPSKPLGGVPSNALAHRDGVGRVGSEALVLGEESEKGTGEPRFDVWLAQLQEDYPQQRVTYGFMTSSAFFDTFQKDPRQSIDVWNEMRANLENHKAGYEWRVKGMVPKLEKWLLDGLWRQHHDPDPPVGEQLGGRTNRTISAAAKIIGGGS